MDRNELEMLSQLLEEDDFAKGIAMGLSSERAAALARLRAMQPWQNERYSNSDIGNGFCSRIFIRYRSFRQRAQMLVHL